MTSSITLDLILAILAVAMLVILTRLAALVAGGAFEAAVKSVELESEAELERLAA